MFKVSEILKLEILAKGIVKFIAFAEALGV